MAKFRILAVDGGGVRGVFAARLLERLDERYPGFLSRTDLFAGTSTGGILALGLAAGMTPKQCREFYEAYSPAVFPRWFPYDLGVFRSARRLVRAVYGNQDLKAALAERFGERTLGSLQPRWVLVASFALDNPNPRPGLPRAWKAKFFHNFPDHPRQKTDAHERIVDVALRSSAAPTFLPVYEGFVDGGVVANNPSMCALAQAVNEETGRQQLDDVVLLSVGTGLNPLHLSARHASWGIWQWMLRRIKLTDVFVDGTVGLAEYQCRQVLCRRFHRLNPVLAESVELDDSDLVAQLVELADRADLSDQAAARLNEPAARTADWLETCWLS